MQCQVVPLVWVQFELVCDDPKNTVLMMPPSLSHWSLEGDDRGWDERVGIHCGDGLLGYGEDEVRVSHVWEDRGELVVRVVKFARIRPHKTNYLILIPRHEIFDSLYNYFRTAKVTWPLEKKNTAAQMGYSSKPEITKKTNMARNLQCMSWC